MKNLFFLLLVLSLNVSYTLRYSEANIAVRSSYQIDSTRQSIYIKINGKIKLNSNIEAKINDIAFKLGTQPEYLKVIIYHECKFNPQAINKHTKAVGLIQFMPSTLKGLGYKWQNVYNMNILQQLDVVYAYYKAFGFNYKNPYSLWLTTFYPYAIRHIDNESYVFGSERSDNFARKMCRVNKGFDLNRDGYITMSEYKEYHSLLIDRLTI